MRNLYSCLLFMLFISVESFAHEGDPGIRYETIRNGIGIGTVIAAITSWERNKSVLFVFIHGIFSWLYVIYFVLTRKKEERK